MCTVAIANSPTVFSPRVSSIFCKNGMSSPDALALNQHHHHHQHGSSPRSSSGSTAASSSPFRVRIQSGLRTCSKEGLVVGGGDDDGGGGGGGGGGLDSGSSRSSEAVVPPHLKRKRPARIDIPVSSLSFAAAERPVVTDLELEVEREFYSVYCKKGRREAMEDRYSAVLDLQGDPKQALFGVFDGHGGVKAAEFAAENLHKNIENELTNGREEDTIEAVKYGYLTTDTEFLKDDVRGGTCCVTALIKKNKLVVSNAGDCRAVMSKGGVAKPLTSDHRPSRDDEKCRIENHGGYVDCCNGVWRLQGSLAVSRGIGDKHLKQWVIAEPETKVLRIEQDCEFLLLASDGLWDKVSNQEAIDIARPLYAGTTKPDMLTACKRLVELAAVRGSIDDISVMAIQLGNFI